MFDNKLSVTTLARYSQYIFYEEICSTKHDYLHARRLGRRAVLDALAGEFDMLDSEQGEQGRISLVYRSSNTTPL